MTWNEDKTAITYFDGTEHDFLSNFHPSPIVWRSRKGYAQPTEAATVEHAFQAEKADSPSEYVRILTARTPGLAKSLGRKTSLTPDWEAIKQNVMRDALTLKFRIPQLREQLVATDGVQLIEGNHWHDNIWGDCICGSTRCNVQGQNLLGKMLMEIRQAIIVEQTADKGAGK